MKLLFVVPNFFTWSALKLAVSDDFPDASELFSGMSSDGFLECYSSFQDFHRDHPDKEPILVYGPG